jgi:hypothetical protein
VKIPEQLVEYVCGRYRASQQQQQILPPNLRRKQLLRGLNDHDRAELDRALRRGYLSVSSRNIHHQHHQQRGSSPTSLIQAHSRWCAAKNKPQIVLFKSVGDESLDQIRLDFSTVLTNDVDGNVLSMRHELWKTQIIKAAKSAEMDLLCTLEEDESWDDNSEEFPLQRCVALDDVAAETDDTDATAWIASLPLTTFAGQRSRAKIMAAKVAEMFEIPIAEAVVATSHRGTGGGERRAVHKRKYNNNNNHGKRKSYDKRRSGEHEAKRRGGGHRQAW